MNDSIWTTVEIVTAC